MAEFIEVREVGLRDGLQNIKTVVPTELKFAWITGLPKGFAYAQGRKAA